MHTNGEDEVLLALDLNVAAGARTAEGWADWEMRRTRSFSAPAERWLDERRWLGLYRNVTLELVMNRVEQGFAGTWSLSIDTKIGPRRVERDGRIIFQAKGGGAVLFSMPATGLATACGDWKTQTWSGNLTFEQFEAMTTIEATSEITARRC